ncbi:MAG: hypothetical protein IT236_05565 [Bacteroidia bacterium]|nr:hypothetical protein [Bacteroidia bacterium]
MDDVTGNCFRVREDDKPVVWQAGLCEDLDLVLTDFFNQENRSSVIRFVEFKAKIKMDDVTGNCFRVREDDKPVVWQAGLCEDLD